LAERYKKRGRTATGRRADSSLFPAESLASLPGPCGRDTSDPTLGA
jgi:hypothetical protein